MYIHKHSKADLQRELWLHLLLGLLVRQLPELLVLHIKHIGIVQNTRQTGVAGITADGAEPSTGGGAQRGTGGVGDGVEGYTLVQTHNSIIIMYVQCYTVSEIATGHWSLSNHFMSKLRQMSKQFLNVQSIDGTKFKQYPPPLTLVGAGANPCPCPIPPSPLPLPPPFVLEDSVQPLVLASPLPLPYLSLCWRTLSNPSSLPNSRCSIYEVLMRDCRRSSLNLMLPM